MGVSRVWGLLWKPSQVLASSLDPLAIDFLTQPSASQNLLSTSSRKPQHWPFPHPLSQNPLEIKSMNLGTLSSALVIWHSECVQPGKPVQKF